MNRFHSILAKRIGALGAGDPEGRKRLYAQTRSELDRLLAKSEPPQSAYQRLKHMQALETAIADVEAKMLEIEARLATPVPDTAQAAAPRPAAPHHPPAQTAPPRQQSPQRQLPPPGDNISTRLPPRQGRDVEDLLREQPDQEGLSPGVILAIIGGLALLMLIGVIIALDPSSLDILQRNPGQ